MSKFSPTQAIIHARQRGAMTILTIFIVLMSLGALGVLGLGQVVWEREDLQRIADLAAKAAASDIDNASTNNFQAARDYAVRNGLELPEDSIDINCNVKGTDNLLPANACQSSVLVRVTRTVPAAFLGNEPVVAVAEATVAPFVSGIVGTNLLSANLNGGVLSPLLDQIGVKLNISSGFSDLLASDLQVDLQQLARNLNVPGSDSGTLDLGALLNESVPTRDLLNAAADAAGLAGPGLGSMNDPALDTPLPLGNIFSADDAIAANIPVASVRLGNLAFAAALSAATLLPSDTLQINVGDIVRASVIEPPQLFVAVKRPNQNGVLVTARTEQISLNTRINGVVTLDLQVGAGEVDILDIECRLPQSSSAVVADLRSSAVNVTVDLPALPSVLGILGIVLIPGRPAGELPPVSLGLVSASNQRFEGYPDPLLEGRYSFETAQGLPNLLAGITSQISLLGSLLNVLGVNDPVNVALGAVGGRLDTLLDLAGLGVNEVVVQIDSMDCFNTAVLTR